MSVTERIKDCPRRHCSHATDKVSESRIAIAAFVALHESVHVQVFGRPATMALSCAQAGGVVRSLV